MKKTIVLLLMLLLSASLLQAEESAESEMSFWDKIRAKIEKVTRQKKPAVTTAVGGVRAAKSESGQSLYWKGENVPPTVSEQELEAFKQALTLAESGELTQGRDLFEQFLDDYPKSFMKDDALFALQEIRSGLDTQTVK